MCRSSGLNPKTEVSLQKETKETKETKQEEAGRFVCEIFLTALFRADRPFSSWSLLPSVNFVSEFRLKGLSLLQRRSEP